MYIEPNTVIKLCKGVPLDKDFVNTLYFADKTTQTAYFNSKAKYSFSAQTFQRVDVGVARLQVDVGNVYDCNYMMFQNTSFSNKWFYAFIDRVEYHNNGLTNVYFTIDPLQTWFFDCTLQQCYVEREHSLTDGIGDNIIDEGLACGEYICTAEREHVKAIINYGEVNCTAFVFAVFTTFPFSRGSTISSPNIVKRYRIDPSMTGNFYNPFYITFIDVARDGLDPTDSTDALAITNEIVQLIQDAGSIAQQIMADWKIEGRDNIVGFYAFPSSEFWFNVYAGLAIPEGDNFYSAYINTTSVRTGSQDMTPRTLSITPKNNKLYTYPYCMLNLISDSDVVQLNYDLFPVVNNVLQLKLEVKQVISPNFPTCCYPKNYAGESIDVKNSVTVNLGVELPFTFDDLMNSITTFALKAGTSLISAGLTGGIAPVAATTKTPTVTTKAYGGKTITRTNKKGEVVGQSITPARADRTTTTYGDTRHTIENPREVAVARAVRSALDELPDVLTNNGISSGLSKSDDMLLRDGKKLIYSQCRCIRPEYAHIIDDYFTRFGYACKRTKVPNISSRPHWNYVQTVDCALSGDAPADAIEDIQAIFNNGITFWKNASEVGNYSLDNSPV